MLQDVGRSRLTVDNNNNVRVNLNVRAVSDFVVVSFQLTNSQRLNLVLTVDER